MQHIACTHTSVKSLPFLLFLSLACELLPLPQPQQPQLLFSTKKSALHTYKPHHTEQQLNYLFCRVDSTTEEGNVQPMVLSTLPDPARTSLWSPNFIPHPTTWCFSGLHFQSLLSKDALAPPLPNLTRFDSCTCITDPGHCMEYRW